MRVASSPVTISQSACEIGKTLIADAISHQLAFSEGHVLRTLMSLLVLSDAQLGLGCYHRGIAWTCFLKGNVEPGVTKMVISGPVGWASPQPGVWRARFKP